MSQRLFSVPKTGLFLDKYTPGVEKRDGDEVKIVTLSLRCQPFDAKLATAIDEGLGDDSAVRANLFKLSTTEPKPHIDRVNLTLGCPRQNLIVFASSDTLDSRIAFLQAKISGTYARTSKDVDGYAFVFKASFGPIGREEQEFIHYWFRSQLFVTFDESEPVLWDEADVATAERPLRAGGESPVWGDDDEPFNAPASAAADEAPPTPKKRGRPKTKKHEPEAERLAQEQAAKEHAEAST